MLHIFGKNEVDQDPNHCFKLHILTFQLTLIWYVGGQKALDLYSALAFALLQPRQIQPEHPIVVFRRNQMTRFHPGPPLQVAIQGPM